MNKSVRVENSKTNKPVPIVDDIYLHSIFDPEKEAKAFANNNIEHIKVHQNFIVLGLGFAYHIREIINLAKVYHSQFNIIVIEPNKELISTYRENGNQSKEDFEIVTHENIEDYYFDSRLIKAMLNKPKIFRLDTAFNLDLNFYKSFLTYKVNKNLNHYKERLKPEVKDIFEPIIKSSLEQSFNEIISKKSEFTKPEYFLLALKEIIQSNKAAT